MRIFEINEKIGLHGFATIILWKNLINLLCVLVL
jgi:hypothetical protein